MALPVLAAAREARGEMAAAKMSARWISRAMR